MMGMNQGMAQAGMMQQGTAQQGAMPQPAGLPGAGSQGMNGAQAGYSAGMAMGQQAAGSPQRSAAGQAQTAQPAPPILRALMQMVQQVLLNPQAMQMFRQELMQTHDPELAAAETIAMVTHSVMATAAQQGASVPAPIVSQLLLGTAEMVLQLLVKMQVFSVQQAQQLARPVLAMALHTFKNGRGSVAGKPLPSLQRRPRAQGTSGARFGAMQQGAIRAGGMTQGGMTQAGMQAAPGMGMGG